MDRRQDGAAAEAMFAANPVPVRSERIAPRTGHAAGGRATRRGAAGRPAPLFFLPDGTATGAAARDTGSARRRPRTTEPCHTPVRRGGRARNASRRS